MSIEIEKQLILKCAYCAKPCALSFGEKNSLGKWGYVVCNECSKKEISK